MGTVRQRRRSKHGAMASSSRKSKRKVAERRYKTKTGMSESGKKVGGGVWVCDFCSVGAFVSVSDPLAGGC